MNETFDLLLTGGTVLNPATKTNEKLDVGVKGDRVTAIQADIPPTSVKRVIDATGCYVTPGLIDFHVHSYWGVNPYGCDLDAVCLATGVTTALDAGSAGPVNLLGFRKLVYERSKTRMIAFVALAQHGVLNEPGELLNLGFADLDGSAQAVIDNRDLGVGIKVRLHKKSIGDNSRDGVAPGNQGRRSVGYADDGPCRRHGDRHGRDRRYLAAGRHHHPLLHAAETVDHR